MYDIEPLVAYTTEKEAVVDDKEAEETDDADK
jgi:hypothetical protein